MTDHLFAYHDHEGRTYGACLSAMDYGKLKHV